MSKNQITSLQHRYTKPQDPQPDHLTDVEKMLLQKSEEREIRVAQNYEQLLYGDIAPRKPKEISIFVPQYNQPILMFNPFMKDIEYANVNEAERVTGLSAQQIYRSINNGIFLHHAGLSVRFKKKETSAVRREA